MKYHKWVGLVFAFLIIMFAVSGIVMNHRKLFSGIDVPRSILPKDYYYNNWNNASVKGSIKISPDSVLLYGGSGVWLTDSLQSQFQFFCDGFHKGADNHIVSRIVKTGNNIFATTTFNIFKLENDKWIDITHLTDVNERISDMEICGDTLVVMSRSNIYYSVLPFNQFHKKELAKPSDYEAKTNMFRFLWLLHSGELFGIAGKLFVDLLGILLIIVSVTGILYFFFPKIIKRRKKKDKPVKKLVKSMKSTINWHNKISITFLVFFFILAFSGMFLRPPLLIAVIRAKLPNIPGTVLNSRNPWHDKLRTIRHDRNSNTWIIYTSSGFYRVTDFNDTPVKIANTPPVSVMGVTVLEPTAKGWLTGSFSGLFYWEPETGKVFDCYTGQPVIGRRAGRPVSTNPISGYSGDFNGYVVFEYEKGVKHFGGEFKPMPNELEKGRMSLWHLALEIHTGRIYSSVIGPFSDLYIFLSGVIVILLLISGYALYRRKKGYKIKSTQ